MSDGEWSDESENVKDKKKGKKDKKVLGKRANKDREDEDHDAAKDFFGSGGFEEVPANDPGVKNANRNDESLDSDEIAETRILAKKMLRKKSR